MNKNRIVQTSSDIEIYLFNQIGNLFDLNSSDMEIFRLNRKRTDLSGLAGYGNFHTQSKENRLIGTRRIWKFPDSIEREQIYRDSSDMEISRFNRKRKDLLGLIIDGNIHIQSKKEQKLSRVVRYGNLSVQYGINTRFIGTYRIWNTCRYIGKLNCNLI